MTLVLIQILAIVATARLCAILARPLGQPRVVAEMVAGILLGPTLLGALWPEAYHWLFPVDQLQNLKLLSQLGLAIFMFMVGLEIDVAAIGKKLSTALVVSQVSTLVPFVLGVLVAPVLFNHFATGNASLATFSIFMGIAMSITAFPVLARILKERGLTTTRIGSLALTSAALGDVAAWCALALLAGLVAAGSWLRSLATVLLSFTYLVAMACGVRPWLAKLLADRAPLVQMLAMASLALASALLAEWIGLHALFGAFFAGAIIPRGLRQSQVGLQRLQRLTAMWLLPLFFAFTGLRMDLSGFSGPQDWMMTLAVIVLAVAGKIGGGALAGLLMGLSKRESWTIGSLMNTRGLMELVVLNIGYDLGILPPAVFAIMVIMALVTTMMTGPLLRLCLPRASQPRAVLPQARAS